MIDVSDHRAYQALFKGKEELALREAVAGLRHEVDLYWRRSTYFWTLLYCPRVLGQWFDGIRFYAAASSPTRSRRTWAGLR